MSRLVSLIGDFAFGKLSRVTKQGSEGCGIAGKGYARTFRGEGQGKVNVKLFPLLLYINLVSSHNFDLM